MSERAVGKRELSSVRMTLRKGSSTLTYAIRYDDAGWWTCKRELHESPGEVLRFTWVRQVQTELLDLLASDELLQDNQAFRNRLFKAVREMTRK